MFFGSKNNGAFLNNRFIKVATRDDLEFSAVSVTMGSVKTTKRERKIVYDEVVNYGLWLSRVESVALTGSYVAAGRFDILISKNLAPWDYCAAALILQEAGARVSDFKGRAYRWNFEEIVAANPYLHPQVIRFTRKI